MYAEIQYINRVGPLQQQIQLIVKGSLILTSLLTPRILTEFFSFGTDIVTFRIFYTLFIAFDFIIPVLLTIILFRRVGRILSFIIPFLVYGVLCPIIDASWLSFQGHLIINLIPINALFGGVGLGIIGLGSSQIERDKTIATVTMFLGVIILMASIPNFFAIIHWLATGDPDSLLCLL